MARPRIRPEQLGLDLTNNLEISSSNGYFVFDASGSVYLDFAGVDGDSFSIKRSGSVLFSVEDSGRVTITNDLVVSGSLIAPNLSITASVAQTASHLQEQSVAIFAPIDSIPGYISGGIFYSSSGEWYFS
jgi:hypothetical protein